MVDIQAWHAVEKGVILLPSLVVKFLTQNIVKVVQCRKALCS